VLGQNVFVAARAVLGNGCKIQNNVSLYDDVILEDDVFVAPSAVFTNVVNPRSFIERKHEYRTTRVGRGASVGANATVVCGHTSANTPLSARALWSPRTWPPMPWSPACPRVQWAGCAAAGCACPTGKTMSAVQGLWPALS